MAQLLFGFSLKLSGSGFEPMPGRMFVIEVDHNSAPNCLKGLAQAKIIKKSLILFCLLNMTI